MSNHYDIIIIGTGAFPYKGWLIKWEPVALEQIHRLRY